MTISIYTHGCFQDFFGIEHDIATRIKEKQETKDVDTSANFIDEQYFGELKTLQEQTNLPDQLKDGESTSLTANHYAIDPMRTDARDSSNGKIKVKSLGTEFEETSNYIDQLYFGERLHSARDDKIQVTGSLSHTQTQGRTSVKQSGVQMDETDNFIDQLYFGERSDCDTTDPGSGINPILHNSTKTKTKPPQQLHKRERNTGQTLLEPNEIHHSQTPVIKQKTEKFSTSSPRSVADMANDIRQRARINQSTGGSLGDFEFTSIKPEKLDSLGYRIPCDNPFNFKQLTEDEAAWILFKSVVDIRDNILVLNKPHGVASHPGPGQEYSVFGLLPRLRHLIRTHSTGTTAMVEDSTDYQIVHRLDKECSGLMLIARNSDSALRLQEAFAKRWIRKDYICVTVGIPQLDSGYLRLPIVEKNFNGVHKMCVNPLNRRVQSRSGDSTASDFESISSEGEDVWSELNPRHPSTPVTRYEILDRRNGAALLLCSTLSGLKHQIRVHLAMELGTPILGDHKYSHASYLAPQRLPRQLCDALKIRQSKVRHISLHLHASQIRFGPEVTINPSSCTVPPGFFHFIRTRENQQTSKLNLIAPPPQFFMENLRRFGLKLPRYLSRLCVR